MMIAVWIAKWSFCSENNKTEKKTWINFNENGNGLGRVYVCASGLIIINF